MKKLYLDVCTYCRPFDDQQVLRIRLETDAFYLILKHIEMGHYQAVVSSVHFREVGAISTLEERLKIETILKRTQTNYLWCDRLKIRDRAEQLHTIMNFGVADAAHVAYAEQLADIFITCDDKLLNKCKNNPLAILAMNPIEFLVYEDLL